MKFAVMGHGVVGSGTVQLFFKNREKIEKSCAEPMQLKYILDIRDFNGFEYDNLFIKDFELIENDPEISVVVETIGGVGAAFDYVERCLKKGKSVVTSNKELVASRGTSLLKLAESTGAAFKFEASVGGCIPVLKPTHQCLAANRFYSITGILNGTTNFILTKMEEESMLFEDALELARKMGYAENNPAADVDGHDCARKISILGGVGFGLHIHPDDIPVTGIRGVTLEDIRLARALGGSLKFISRASGTDAGISASVCPSVVPSSNLLSGIKDVFNAIIADGDATGEVMFYGKGAGKLPTASAVLSDISDCVRESASPRRIEWIDCFNKPSGNEENRWLLRLKDQGANALPPSCFTKIECGEINGGYVSSSMTKARLDSLLKNIRAAVYPVLK